jgi:hypothetical protein
MGPLWTEMDARPRKHVPDLAKADIPTDPGVYAAYREGKAIYVGKAKELQGRVWKDHCGKGRVMTGSAFRRNVAEHLGISTPNEIYKKRYQPTDAEVARVRGFIEECEIAWIVCPSEIAALTLEDNMKLEWMPPLTKS